MKKILFVTHTLGGGGAEKVLINLLKNLAMDDNLHVTLLSIVDTGIYRGYIPDKVAYKSFISLPFRKIITGGKKEKSGSLLISDSIIIRLLIKVYTIFWKYIPAVILHKMIIKDYYDYEIAFLEGICAKVVSGGKGGNVKYAWIHVDLLQQHKSKNIFDNIYEERSVYDKFNNIICVSQCVKDSFEKIFDFTNNDKVIVKYNPINVSEIVNKSLSKNIHKNDVFTICSVGRLNKQKQYIRLLSAMRDLQKKNIKAVCYILGEGTDRKYLEEYIENNGLTDNVFLLGYVDNPYPYVSNADLFVCCSVAEGFSTAVSEAVILGVPVVTTKCAGMDEILGNSEYGLIVENDERALSRGIERMIVDKKMYYKYKKAAMERKKFFDLDYRCSEIKRLFA